jgi:hypothetical protein
MLVPIHRRTRAGNVGALLVVAAMLASVSIVTPVASAAPVNDSFATPAVIDGAVVGFGQSVSTVDASGEVGEPNHAGVSLPLESVWFQWTPTASGRTTVSTCASGFDTTLAVYTGDSVDALTEVASDDDGCGLQSIVKFFATAGVTYSIALDGADDEDGSASMYLQRGTMTGNDDFANALVIPSQFGTSSLWAGNFNMGGELGEPNHAGVSLPLESLWFRWTAPGDADVSVDTCSVSDPYDTTLAVYTGTSLDALQPIAASDDGCERGNGSAIAGQAQAGVTYSIAVDGVGGSVGGGTITFSATPRAAPQPAQPASPATASAPQTRPDTAAPVVRLSAVSRQLRAAIANGVRLRVRMSEAGRACGTLRLGLPAARRAGLRPTKTERRRGWIAVGSRCITFTDPGTRTLRVRFSGRAARAFRKVVRARRNLTVLARVVVTDVAGNRRTINSRVRLLN